MKKSLHVIFLIFIFVLTLSSCAGIVPSFEPFESDFLLNVQKKEYEGSLNFTGYETKIEIESPEDFEGLILESEEGRVSFGGMTFKQGENSPAYILNEIFFVLCEKDRLSLSENGKVKILGKEIPFDAVFDGKTGKLRSISFENYVFNFK